MKTEENLTALIIMSICFTLSVVQTFVGRASCPVFGPNHRMLVMLSYYGGTQNGLCGQYRPSSCMRFIFVAI